MDTTRTDILIIGSGGAGLLAALHAHLANPELDITIATKGLIGKCGCTRMVQGGYNVALADGDSVERHFMDTIIGGKWLPDQDLAWTLVTGAVEQVLELENRYGCYFDRNADGTLHQKAFAGQSFDRTVHKGDLTGIEIINRLMEQVWATPMHLLEEHRALALVPAKNSDAIAGALFIDMRSGEPRFVKARAVLLATGGGPTMYRYHTPSGDKSCDGLAMALRSGLTLRDMEMVQFHPTGVLAGPQTRMTGTIIEEGLRGAGGYLLNGSRERFMFTYDEAGERATRDIVSRAMFEEVRAGRGTDKGGLILRMAHLGPEKVARQFKGMVKRCADIGFDLAGGDVDVLPTAHYMMGGVCFTADCTTTIEGLYVAGEDSGGVHGANRLGGNGVANSTVFGSIAGDSMAAAIKAGLDLHEPDNSIIEDANAGAHRPLDLPQGDIAAIRERLYDVMWNNVGIIRQTDGLNNARGQLEELAASLSTIGIKGQPLAFNLTWHDWLNLESQILVSQAIVEAALMREDSRGAHYRENFPDTRDIENSFYTNLSLSVENSFERKTVPVVFSKVRPGESLLDPSEPVPPAAAIANKSNINSGAVTSADKGQQP